MDDSGRQSTLDQLTHRELDILRLVTDGQSNQEIAERLVITLGTVKWYLKQIYGKLHVSSRTQAIAAARNLSLLGATPGQAEPSAPRHNLPAQATPFVGRIEELVTIADRL